MKNDLLIMITWGQGVEPAIVSGFLQLALWSLQPERWQVELQK